MKEMMPKIENEKLPEGARRRVDGLLNSLRQEFGDSIEINETPDIISITIERGSEKERILNFTKAGGKLPVKSQDNLVPIEKIIEASVRHPDKKLSEALEELK